MKQTNIKTMTSLCLTFGFQLDFYMIIMLQHPNFNAQVLISCMFNYLTCVQIIYLQTGFGLYTFIAIPKKNTKKNKSRNMICIHVQHVFLFDNIMYRLKLTCLSLPEMYLTWRFYFNPLLCRIQFETLSKQMNKFIDILCLMKR